MRNRSYTVAGLACLACLTFAASASAEPQTHDGFMLQLELGPGYLSMPGTVEGGGLDADATIKGMALVGGLLIGGTPAPGVVIGGATHGHVVPSPKLEANGQEMDLEEDLSLGLIGPFVQYYPDPSSGLNFRLVLGYATASGTDDDADDAATGFGLTAAVGHDWWIGEEWSLGVAGRFTYANVKWEDSGVTQKYNAIVPGAVLTLTYH